MLCGDFIEKYDNMKCLILFFISAFILSCSSGAKKQEKKLTKDSLDNESIKFDKIEQVKDFYLEYKKYYNISNEKCTIEDWKIKLLFESIDTNLIKETLCISSFVFFQLSSSEEAVNTFNRIAKKAYYVIKEKPQKYGQIGTFYKGGGSYFQYNNFIVYHFLYCSITKEKLDIDKGIWEYLKGQGIHGKYLRLICSYKDLTILK